MAIAVSMVGIVAGVMFFAVGYVVGFGEGVRYNARKWRENVKIGSWKKWRQ